MSKLYLITGPAGVGKSTISKLIAESLARSALIEGDEIYALVKSGYVSPWLEGNHLGVFWKNCTDIIKNFLEDGYDVVFNYIIGKEYLEMLKNEFMGFETTFTVLMVDEQTIIKRDKERPLDCRMGERSLVLLKEFKDANYDENFILDTSNLNIDETVKRINEKRFNLNKNNNQRN
jgi:2-phosphoglycerate kinase